MYKIKANEKKNALHGGKAGFDKQLWNVETVTDSSITFNIKSPDNDQGFPGNLEVIHTITLKEGAICLDYQAVCDKKTHVSLTNHSYFNLNGEGSGSINGHKVQIFSKKITPVNDESIPTGEIAEIKDTFLILKKRLFCRISLIKILIFFTTSISTGCQNTILRKGNRFGSLYRYTRYTVLRRQPFRQS